MSYFSGWTLACDAPYKIRVPEKGTISSIVIVDTCPLFKVIVRSQNALLLFLYSESFVYNLGSFLRVKNAEVFHSF